MEFYPGDSYWTLSRGGQFGLALLSLLFAAGVLWSVRWLQVRIVGAGRGLANRLVLSLAAYWAFLWLSPQLYYTYYQAILPGLRWQVVIDWPPGPMRIWELMAFAPARPSLAEHARGLLGWALALMAVRRRR